MDRRGDYRDDRRDERRDDRYDDRRDDRRDDRGRYDDRGGNRTPPPRSRSPPRRSYRSPARDDRRSPLAIRSPPRRREDSRDREDSKRRRTERPVGERRLWVGGLPHWYEKEDLMKLFDRFGPLYLVDLRKGFAFLEYEHPEDATRARDEMHGYEPERGRVVLVEFRLRGQERVEHRVPETYVSRRRSPSPPPRRRSPSPPPRRRSPSPRPRRDDRDRGRSPNGYDRRDDNRYGGSGGGGGYSGGGRGGGGFGYGGGSGKVKNWRLEIDGMSDRTSWQDVKDWGRDAGLRVEFTAVQGQGHGNIEFTSRDEMERALRLLKDKPLGGVVVRLEEARVQPDSR